MKNENKTEKKRAYNFTYKQIRAEINPSGIYSTYIISKLERRIGNKSGKTTYF